MLLIYSNRDNSGYRIRKYDGSSESETEFSPTWWARLGYDQLDFVIAPDGSKILYSLFSSQEIYNHTANSIWISDINGENPEMLVSGTDQWLPEEAIWSPDGKYIAYRRALITPEEGVISTFELWIIDVDQKSEKLIYVGGKNGSSTVGGQMALFEWYRNGYIYLAPLPSDLTTYAVNSETGEVSAILYATNPISLRFLISPDGEHVISKEKGKVVNLDKSRLLPVEIDDHFIGWSKNGKKAVFEINDKNSKKVVIRDEKTKEEKEVDFKISDRIYGLSPDDNFLVYLGDDGLCILDLKKNLHYSISKGSTRLPPGVDAVTFKTWIPVP